ncbi:PhoX family protein [Zwartia panacis]|uniref:PhoX family protein n=1 Tax=Zwartia panacis TaxID=2683345 RepID=UPI0025B32240|nr:PhoX family phosphatase [Zwartia panacis]MDN4017766.1 PhoX family phosphatase [Zwartia panacis]
MSQNKVNANFQTVLGQALSSPARRMVLKGGLGLSALALLPETLQSAFASPVTGNVQSGLGFHPVDKSLLDDVLLPPGYRYSILHATGDGMMPGVAPYSNAGIESDDWSGRIGDHHDGMELFYVDDKGRYSAKATDRAVLCVNHESSADAHFLHPKGQTSAGSTGKKFDQFGAWDLGDRPETEVIKEINLHGVSIVELVREGNGWRYRVDGSLNRRITPETKMLMAGPSDSLHQINRYMSTRYDPTGQSSRGTLNNCGHGKTPWGTYLTCEENWARYFQITPESAPLQPKQIAALKRYGVASQPLSKDLKKAYSQGWHTVSSKDDRFARWNIALLSASPEGDFRQEANTFGFNVEIDPLEPSSMPVKRTAMGRFAHEAAVCAEPKAGEPLAFYMGCDSVNEYIYKYVSEARWDPADVGGGIRVGDKYLNDGRLYAARFNADGTGEWLELTFQDPKIQSFGGYRFSNQADVLVHARLAADAVGATPMDRPEWGAVNYRNGDIYFALTNNSAANRTPAKVNAANPRAYKDPDGIKRAGNPHGHIIRFREQDVRSNAKVFSWDIFLFGAEEDDPRSNLSGLTAANSFSSPDGLWFSRATGICWIQTDDGAMTDESNCMMLAAIPGSVGDGEKLTVANSMQVGSEKLDGSQETFVGATLGEARLRRFLVAPRGAEVTGLTETEDGRTLFVNIQHPGEKTPALGGKDQFSLESAWPGNQGYGQPGRPRSATIMIQREDGGLIGL